MKRTEAMGIAATGGSPLDSRSGCFPLAVGSVGMTFVRKLLAVFTVLGAFAAHADVRVDASGVNNTYPFDLGENEWSRMRYQQLYAAEAFRSSSPLTITGLRFAVAEDGFGRPFDAVLDSLVISLSTSDKTPSSLSTSFAENLGPDAAVVFEGPIRLSSRGPGNAPPVFDVVIPFKRSFVYDAAAGDLLLDIQNNNDVITSPFRAGFTPLLGRVYGEPGNSWVDAGYGLATEFVTTVVPEPQSDLMVGLGLAAIATVVARRRPAARQAV
ncbi:PEP-CTERM sorting domain-containing protein [Aquabacterium sp. A7-Y]|uniref:PEP-CTERM sorting domain-containing protein n=1 Tax=Aquabacterium sp. A7-Y TaxID=1349605 RepID=UPI00223E2A20|nr:PEP-CTERM sorting domain-containing protein [Aquabacterium sp. A7-Y]MCW7540912.1 PEP-CTERM sorting domain-containing protein [Aquabacterium sp. A7-Y]